MNHSTSIRIRIAARNLLRNMKGTRERRIQTKESLEDEIFGGSASSRLGEYFSKMKGRDRREFSLGITKAKAGEIFWAWLGAALGVGLTAYVSARFFEPRDSLFLLGSFGASAVLIYGAINSPLAQPRNIVGGHVISG